MESDQLSKRALADMSDRLRIDGSAEVFESAVRTMLGPGVPFEYVAETPDKSGHWQTLDLEVRTLGELRILSTLLERARDAGVSQNRPLIESVFATLQERRITALARALIANGQSLGEVYLAEFESLLAEVAPDAEPQPNREGLRVAVDELLRRERAVLNFPPATPAP